MSNKVGGMVKIDANNICKSVRKAVVLWNNGVME
jgi:hypothetical protein